VEAAATEVRRARRDELGGAARLVPNYLPLDVPRVKAGDVELDAGSVGATVLAQPLHQHLRFGHDLAAPVAGFPAARTAPHPRDVVLRKSPVRQLCSNQETKGGLIHRGAPRGGTGFDMPDSPGSHRQRGTGRRPGCRQTHSVRPAGPRQVGPWSNASRGGLPRDRCHPRPQEPGRKRARPGASITTELGVIAGGGGQSRLHLHRDRHLSADRRLRRQRW